MKRFAITPDAMAPEEILGRLGGLREKGVSFVYLRAPGLQGALGEILPAVHRAGMLPLVPFGSEPVPGEHRRGVHFKSADTERIGVRLPAPVALRSAACHDPGQARSLLEQGVEYVFVSPVFPPLSKPSSGPGGALFPRDGLRELVRSFGERVVALGGMRPDRIEELARDMNGDFSVAGIHLFFGGTDA